MIRVDHDCYWLFEEVIAPAVHSVRRRFKDQVLYIHMEVWDATVECANDYGNEYVILTHLTPGLVNDEPLDSDLGSMLGLAIEEAVRELLDERPDGDLFIEVQRTWLMNTSITLPITMQK